MYLSLTKTIGRVLVPAALYAASPTQMREFKPHSYSFPFLFEPYRIPQKLISSFLTETSSSVGSSLQLDPKSRKSNKLFFTSEMERKTRYLQFYPSLFGLWRNAGVHNNKSWRKIRENSVDTSQIEKFINWAVEHNELYIAVKQPELNIHYHIDQCEWFYVSRRVAIFGINWFSLYIIHGRRILKAKCWRGTR